LIRTGFGSPETSEVERPSRTVCAADKLIGLIKICDFHVFGVPEQLLASRISISSCTGQIVTPQGQIAHQYRLCEGPCKIKRRADFHFSVTGAARVHPLCVMSFF